MFIFIVSSRRVSASLCCSFVLSKASCMSLMHCCRGSMIFETCSLFLSPNSSCRRFRISSDVVCICSFMSFSWLSTCSLFISFSASICFSAPSLACASCLSCESFSSAICVSYACFILAIASALRCVSLRRYSSASASCFCR